MDLICLVLKKLLNKLLTYGLLKILADLTYSFNFIKWLLIVIFDLLK